jgi:hypothetical protein
MFFFQILIKGKILCRNGMLMLKQENVSVLGGEVDSLMETNTPENILKSTLYVILYHEFNATENICILCNYNAITVKPVGSLLL